jgi:hypothetical protein
MTIQCIGIIVISIRVGGYKTVKTLFDLSGGTVD